MSIRLNQSLRDKIIYSLVEHRFAKEFNKIEIKRRLFSEYVYKSLYSKTERCRMSRLPDGWLNEVTSLYFNFGGRSSYIKFLNKKRITNKHGSGSPSFAATHEVCQRWQAIEDELSQLKEQKSIAIAHAKALMNSCSTVAKLKSIWPECSKYIPTEVNITSELAIPIPQLNQLFGLK